MKKVILGFLMLGAFLSKSCYAESTWQTIISNPNVSLNRCYDFSSRKTLDGANLSILSYKGIIDAQMGGVKKSDNESDVMLTAGVCVNLDKLNFVKVQYLLKDTFKMSMGLWAGMDFDTHAWAGGLSLSLVKITKPTE